MKKEEILRRARQEGDGEYEERIQGQIMTRSALVVVGLCAAFWLVRAGRAWTAGTALAQVWDYPAIATGYAAFVHLWMYKRLDQRVNLVSGLCCLLAFVIFSVQFWLHL